MHSVGVCCGLRRAGLRPGREIAVIGFDGIEEGLYAEEPLTTVIVPVRQMCYEAVARLVGQLRGDPQAGPFPVLTPTLREGGTA
jgi:LacI family transcriptional regulator